METLGPWLCSYFLVLPGTKTYFLPVLLLVQRRFGSGPKYFELVQMILDRIKVNLLGSFQKFENIAETLDAWLLSLFFAAPWNNILLLPCPFIGPKKIWIRSKIFLAGPNNLRHNQDWLVGSFEKLKNIAETLEAWLLLLLFAAPWNNILILPCPFIGNM